MTTCFLRRLSVAAFACFALLLTSPAYAQAPQEPATLLAFLPADNLPEQQLELRPESDPASTDSLNTRVMLLDLRVRRLTPDAMGVVLYWTTTSETPGTSFVIERRDEGDAGYRRVARIPNQQSAESRSYSFVDAYNGSSQPSSYRLRRLNPGDGPSLVSAPQAVAGAIPGPVLPLDPEEVSISVAAQ